MILHDFRVKVLSGLLTAIHDLVLVLVVHLLLHVALLCGIGCRLVRSKVPSSSSIVSLLWHATLATKVGPSRPRLRSKIAVLVARWRGGSILVLPSVTSCRRIAILVLCSVGGPINSITKRLSTSAEDREGPEPLVASENLLPILLVANVVERLVRLSFHLQVFNGRLVGKSKFDVEFKEHGHEDGNDSIEHEGYLNNDVLYQLLLVSILRAEVICIQRPLYTFKPSV